MPKAAAAVTPQKPADPQPPTSGRRFTVSFSEEVYQKLTDMAEKSGKSMAEVLRDAIILEDWIQDYRGQGYRVLLEKDNKIRELMLR